MLRQKGREMLRDRDGSHAGTTTAVRDAKRLVQVQVAYVRANVARAAETDLGVHVCAVHVNLAAMLMDDLANLLDRFLENPVCRWIRHHQRGQRLAMRGGFGPQIGK